MPGTTIVIVVSTLQPPAKPTCKFTSRVSPSFATAYTTLSISSEYQFLPLIVHIASSSFSSDSTICPAIFVFTPPLFKNIILFSQSEGTHFHSKSEYGYRGTIDVYKLKPQPDTSIYSTTQSYVAVSLDSTGSICSVHTNAGSERLVQR